MSGGLCGDEECAPGSFEFDASALQKVSVEAGAIGTKSGEPVSAVSEGGTYSQLGFSFKKTFGEVE